MRVATLAVACFTLLALPATASATVEAEQGDACYDLAVLATVPRQHYRASLGDGWNGEFRWEIDVEKVYGGGKLPDRIEAVRIGHTYFRDSYLTHAVLFLRVDAHDGYLVVGIKGWERLDGRGLVATGRVEAIAIQEDLVRCDRLLKTRAGRSGSPP